MHIQPHSAPVGCWAQRTLRGWVGWCGGAETRCMCCIYILAAGPQTSRLLPAHADAPKGLGTKLPAKKDGKKAAAAATDAGSHLASASPGGSKAVAAGETGGKQPNEKGPMVAVQAKPLEVNAMKAGLSAMI